MNQEQIGRHLRAHLNRRNGALRRLNDAVRAIDNGEQRNDPAAQLIIDNRGNITHLYLGRLIANADPNGDPLPPAVARQIIDEMTHAQWNAMDEEEQTDFLISFLELGFNEAFGGTCIEFHGGKALQYFALLAGVPDRHYPNGRLLASAASDMMTQFKGHFDARVTLQATIDSDEIERGFYAAGQYSLARVWKIRIYHHSLVTDEAASVFQPRGIQNRREQRNIARAIALDEAEAEALEEILSSSESEDSGDEADEDSGDEADVVDESEEEAVDESEEEAVDESEEEAVDDSEEEAVDDSEEEAVDDSEEEASFASEDDESSDEEQERPRKSRRSHMHNNAAQDELTGWD